jgi:hypothetical protein
VNREAKTSREEITPRRSLREKEKQLNKARSKKSVLQSEEDLQKKESQWQQLEKYPFLWKGKKQSMLEPWGQP